MTSFRENVKKPDLWHLILLNPQIKIIPKYATALKWCPPLPSTIMQKIRNFEWPVSENMSKNPNFWHLIRLNPQIKIFPKYDTKIKWCPLLPSTIMQKIRNF